MLKPLNDTATINTLSPAQYYQKLRLQSLENKTNDFNVPASVYNMYLFEKRISRISLIFLVVLMTATVSLLLINGLKPQWLSQNVNFSINAIYFFGAIVLFLALIRLFSLSINMNTMQKSLANYGAALKRGIEATPHYFESLYQKLILRQVDHNWASIFFLWFGSLFVAILYGLKEARWVIDSKVFSLDINWKLWIKNGFGDPDLVVYLFIASLMFWVLVHIIFALLRKKRRGDIEAFFSKEALASADVVLKWIKDRRKIWFRSFILANIVLILIPLSYLIVRLIKKRRQKSS